MRHRYDITPSKNDHGKAHTRENLRVFDNSCHKVFASGLEWEWPRRPISRRGATITGRKKRRKRREAQVHGRHKRSAVFFMRGGDGREDAIAPTQAIRRSQCEAIGDTRGVGVHEAAVFRDCRATLNVSGRTVERGGHK